MILDEHAITRREAIREAVVAMLALSSGGALAGTNGCSRANPLPVKPHRFIDPERCIGCGRCVTLCPMGAIALHGKSSIDPDACAECGVCWRSRVCPQDAIREGNLAWPRVIREIFSNPMMGHASTGVLGRGTAGIKTNDTEGRFGRENIGVFVELGRPALGARFHDVEAVVKTFKRHGYDVISGNPVAELIRDKRVGSLRPEVLNEKVLSCLVEFVMPRTEAGKLQPIVREIERNVQTVFNVSVALRADTDGRSPFRHLFGNDARLLPWSKVNIGVADGISGKEG